MRRSSWIRQNGYLLLLFATLSFLSCGSNDDSWLAPIEGTVTFDSKPLPDARVIFKPTRGGLPSEAVTDENGYYKLHYSGNKSGAEVGVHEVRIRTSGMETGAKEIIPARYNANTKLKETVTKDSTTINFDLKPGGEIIQFVEEFDGSEEQ